MHHSRSRVHHRKLSTISLLQEPGPKSEKSQSHTSQSPSSDSPNIQPLQRARHERLATGLCPRPAPARAPQQQRHCARLRPPFRVHSHGSTELDLESDSDPKQIEFDAIIQQHIHRAEMAKGQQSSRINPRARRARLQAQDKHALGRPCLRDVLRTS